MILRTILAASLLAASPAAAQVAVFSYSGPDTVVLEFDGKSWEVNAMGIELGADYEAFPAKVTFPDGRSITATLDFEKTFTAITMYDEEMWCVTIGSDSIVIESQIDCDRIINQ